MARKSSSKRRRRRNPAAAAPHARRARRSPRRYRRNPPGFSPRQLLNVATEGVIGGAEVVAGKAAVRLVRKQLGYVSGTTPAAVVEAVGAVALGMVGAKMLGGEHGRRLMYGGMSAPIEAFLRQAVANSPKGRQLVEDALGDGAYDTVIAYPDYQPVGDYIGAVPGFLTAGDNSVGDYAGSSSYQYLQS